MSQKCYYSEILLELLNGEMHIRGLAQTLKTNQMTISRKIKKLADRAVVDYKKEGRNNTYFIKKTLEAQEHVFIAEHYKFLQALQKYPLLRSIAQKIKTNPRITLAILFGSYAKELAHKDSDIDIYIETTDNHIKKEIEELNTKIHVKIGLYDPHNFLIKEIKKNHVIIKGIEGYYEKTEFFR